MTVQRQSVDVLVEERGTAAKYAGVAYCGSSWCCPVCTPYKLRRMAIKITALLRGRRRRFDESAVMMTFTVPHYRDESAATILGRLLGGRRKLFHSTWAYRAAKYGVSGIVESTEATYSKFNGWHFHLHTLVFFKNGSSFNQRVRGLFEKMQKSWSTYCLQYSRAKHPPTGAHLLTKRNKIVVIESGDYICGWGASELAKRTNRHQQEKRGKWRTTNVFELAGSDDPNDIELFLEFAEATRSKKRVFISRRLNREMDAADYELEKIENLPVKKNYAAVCTFTSDDWSEICERDRQASGYLRVEILAAAMDGNLDGALERIRDVLKIRGLPADYAQAPFRRYLGWVDESRHQQSGFSA